LHQPIVGRGSAFADIDGDGDLDVVFTQIGGSPLLLRNELNPARWARIELMSAGGNRNALGARIQFQYDGRLHSRLVGPTRGYLSQSELPVTLPAGREDTLTVEIVWPDQARESVRISTTGKVQRIERSTR
jgi:hypothetical protein